jgi:ABC-type uncharacterized transport system substrate-binding protein
MRVSGGKTRLTYTSLNDLAVACRTYSAVILSGADMIAPARVACPSGKLLLTGVSLIAYEQIPDGDRMAVTPLFSEHPPLSQLNLALQVTRDVRAIGVLYGSSGAASKQFRELATAAQQTDIRLVSLQVPVGKSPIAVLNDYLADLDVVIALADPEVMNPQSIRPLLLATARRRVPMIGGLSPSYIRAGVAMGAFNSIEHKAEDVWRFSCGLYSLGNQSRPFVYYNKSVVSLLHLTLPDLSKEAFHGF